MRIVPGLVKVVQDRTQVRVDPRGKVGTTRVDLKHLEQKTFEAIYKTEDKNFEIMIDEPAVRG